MIYHHSKPPHIRWSANWVNSSWFYRHTSGTCVAGRRSRPSWEALFKSLRRPAYLDFDQKKRLSWPSENINRLFTFFDLLLSVRFLVLAIGEFLILTAPGMADSAQPPPFDLNTRWDRLLANYTVTYMHISYSFGAVLIAVVVASA
jgi:hypothetical protein